MKKFLRGCLILVSFSYLACTKGAPAFQTISEDNIPRPLFKTGTTLPYATGSLTNTLDVVGTCDPKISDIKATFVNSTASTQKLRELSASNTIYNTVVKCASDGTFSFTLAELSKLGFEITNPGEYTVHLQGITTAGLSKPSVILITYDTRIGGSPPIVINSGGATFVQGADNFSATSLRITNKSVASNPASGADKYIELDGENNFKAHIGVRLNSPMGEPPTTP